MIHPEHLISFADFVAWEQDQEQRHELIGGRIVPFLAASMDHELITGNVFAKLHATVDPPCRVFPSTAIVQTLSRTSVDGYRPDVTISCSTTNIGAKLYVEQPLIVVEVVSPSNSGRDWDRKLFEYWNTPSIAQLVFIDSRKRDVTSHLRDESGLWCPPIILTEGMLDFRPIRASMTLDQIYRNSSLE
jgi:Uma2 family endonuclease